MRWLRQLFRIDRPNPTRRPVRCRPVLESLESREVPTVSSISSNFNGTAIGAGSDVWFSSVGKISGLVGNSATIRIKNATITSNNFTVAVPDSVITISSSVTTASTTFDAASNTWESTIPLSGYSGNVFLEGATLPTPNGLPGGINPVVWQADFTTDTPGVKINWTWAAAVYSQFSTDPNALGVKPVDGSGANPYRNSDHAGTPESFTQFVHGGARGGGGSNFTGSYSATKSVAPEVQVQQPLSTISGFVYLDLNNDGVYDAGDAPISDVAVTLTGVDNNGNSIVLTAITDSTGAFSFTGLPPGTYQLTESQPPEYLDGQDTVGTVNGSPNGQLPTNNVISNITLQAGQAGVNYDFGEIFAGS
jgi:hypothetical protein